MMWFSVLEKNRNGCTHWVWNVFHWQWTFLMKRVYVDVNAVRMVIPVALTHEQRQLEGDKGPDPKLDHNDCHPPCSVMEPLVQPRGLSCLCSPLLIKHSHCQLLAHSARFPGENDTSELKLYLSQSFGLVPHLGGGRGRGIPCSYVNNFYLVLSTN